MAKNSKKHEEVVEAPVDRGADQTTRSDVEQLTADNAVERLTDNEVARRNREVASLGTKREGKDV